jgi:hypothetical protein
MARAYPDGVWEARGSWALPRRPVRRTASRPPRWAERAVTVRFEDGYPFAQVFAPAGQPFLCFEPMTATVSALTHPGGCPLVEA